MLVLRNLQYDHFFLSLFYDHSDIQKSNKKYVNLAVPSDVQEALSALNLGVSYISISELSSKELLLNRITSICELLSEKEREQEEEAAKEAAAEREKKQQIQKALQSQQTKITGVQPSPAVKRQLLVCCSVLYLLKESIYKTYSIGRSSNPKRGRRKGKIYDKFLSSSDNLWMY